MFDGQHTPAAARLSIVSMCTSCRRRGPTPPLDRIFTCKSDRRDVPLTRDKCPVGGGTFRPPVRGRSPLSTGPLSHPPRCEESSGRRSKAEKPVVVTTPVLAGRGSYPAAEQGPWLGLRRTEVPSPGIGSPATTGWMSPTPMATSAVVAAHERSAKKPTAQDGGSREAAPFGRRPPHPGSRSSNERVQRNPRRTQLVRATICRPSLSPWMGGWSSSALGTTGGAADNHALAKHLRDRPP